MFGEMEGQTTRGRPRREWLDDVGLHSEKEGARQRHVETISRFTVPGWGSI